MKRSYLLILIASALLLSASAANLQPSPEPSGIRTEGSNHQQIAHQLAQTSQIKLSEVQTKKTGDTNQHYSNGEQHYPSDRLGLQIGELQRRISNLESPHAITWFTGAIALLALFQILIIFQTFVADHRPRVRVRSVKLLTDISDRGDWVEKSLEFELLVANQGGTKAIFTSSNIAIGIGRRTEPRTLIAIDPVNVLAGNKLKPGAEYTHRFVTDQSERDMIDILTRMAVQKEVFLYIVGDLWYRDPLRQRNYKTAFCRRFIEGERVLNIQKTLPRFVVVNNPEYEYAD